MVFGVRWVPSLAWLTHTPGFLRLHRTMTGWMNENFEHIEHKAGWLELTREEVTDSCATSLASRQWQIPRDPPSVKCERMARRVYGVDGVLSERLDELASALFAVGWGYMVSEDALGMLQGLAERHSPVHVDIWRPVPGFDLPARLEKMPPARAWPSTGWLGMDIEWTTEGPLSNLTPSRLGRWGMRPERRRSPLYWPLERTVTPHKPSPVTATSRQSRHKHEIGITITFTYYNNTNPNWIRGFIPRRLLPIIEARANRFY